MSLTLSAGLRARVRSGELSLDLSATGENAVALVDADGNEVLALRRPFAVDANGDTVEGQLRFRRSLSGLQVSSSYPLDWLRTAVYPVRLDPTVSQAITVGAHDSYSTAGGTFSDSATTVDVGSNSAVIDSRSAWYYTGLGIPQGAVIGSAPFTFDATNALTAGPLTIQFFMDAATSPAIPTTAADMRGRTKTTAFVEFNLTSAMGAGVYTVDLKAVLQEQVNKGAINSVLILANDVNPNFVNNNRVRIRSSESTTGDGALFEITYSNPPVTVSGGASAGSISRATVTIAPRGGTSAQAVSRAAVTAAARSGVSASVGSRASVTAGAAAGVSAQSVSVAGVVAGVSPASSAQRLSAAEAVNTTAGVAPSASASVISTTSVIAGVAGAVSASSIRFLVPLGFITLPGVEDASDLRSFADASPARSALDATLARTPVEASITRSFADASASRSVVDA